ncbi:MAG TPA: sugar transferase [Terriglobia bacterium]|nr:sugar transferase [Terriglobia bacterium]
MGGLERRQLTTSQAISSGTLLKIDRWIIRFHRREDADRPQRGLYLRLGKRALDVLGAFVGLLVTSPILFLCALAIWLDSGAPVFYRQWRVGLRGKPFRIIKLRTMRPNADKQGSKLTACGDMRITKVGRLLRKAKLDEIPQLLNVLRGEMSLVGPRPEVPEYAAQYTPEERHVLEIRPGITGPASLAYIDEERLLADQPDKETFYIRTVMPQKLRVDLAYCRAVGLLEDLRIMFLTLQALLASRMALRLARADSSGDQVDTTHHRSHAA